MKESWDLTRIFKNKEEYDQEVAKINTLTERLVSYKGKINQEDIFVRHLLDEDELSFSLSKCYNYVSMKSDLNKKDVALSKDYATMALLAQSISEKLSYILPEILSMSEDEVFGIFDRHPEIKAFRFGIEKAFREKAHILDGDKEELLSYFSSLSSQGGELYSALTVADGKAKEVKLSNNQKVKVTQGNWRTLIEKASSPRDRKKIFEAVFSYYEDHKTTYGQIYNTVMMAQEAERKARNYKSILESHLFHNNIPTEVFTNLIDVASKNSRPLKKYIKLRKKYLHLSSYHTYDRFLQLAKSDKEYSYEDARTLFFASLKEFPSDFQNKAREVLSEGYVDVYESEGKRSGAYSTGGNGNIHPYILLNYSNSLDDVFTVAHEAGHSMHTLYTMENQPEALRNYTIFVAEIASTFNEHNLLDYLLKSSTLSKEEKIMLLQKSIDEISGTFYRQTLFAHYEYLISKLAENGEAIQHDVLSNTMVDLYKKYYGLDIRKEKVKEYVWAYIPHMFYTPFYVYQYATSFSASLKIYEDVRDGKEGAFDRYINLLKSGGSKFPMQQALEAGVDFTKKDAFLAVTRRMDQLVNELEKLLQE